ncbi:unnamed protein product [Arabis nemorensis]|uniref:Plant thionin family protein n=1 Tax=Arabis nemorensis TaxID=586526 RepID=A0A565BTR9_9BRAS|nr:unnamed protein product [Arabis nemorensis]
MGMKKCIVLMMMVAIVMTAMEDKVEGLSCMDICMFKCGLILLPEHDCLKRCKRECHIQSRFSSQSLQ